MRQTNILNLRFLLLLLAFSCFGLKGEDKNIVKKEMKNEMKTEVKNEGKKDIPFETPMEYGLVFKTEKAKGLLVSYIEDDPANYCAEEGEDIVVFQFFPEDAKDFNGKIIEIVMENSERKELLKKHFKDSEKLLTKKTNYLRQPVEITMTEMYVRPSCGAGSPVYYAKVAEIVELKSTKATFSGKDEEIEERKYKNGEKLKINSKKGCVELKLAPSKNAKTIQEIENGNEYFEIIKKYGDWYYVYSYPIDSGYIHVDDLK